MGYFDFFLDIFFPKECVSCGKEGYFLCEDCCRKIVRIKSPTCPFCKALTPQGQFCAHCRRKTCLSGVMIGAYYEEGALKEAICAYKYKSIRALAEPLSDLLIDHLQKFPLSSNPVLMPVPLHKSRLRQRGFNQAGLLAEKVAKVFDFDYEENVLFRNRKTKPQVELSGRARHENIKDAFRCKNVEKIERRDILLVDDVCTTGSTLEECAKELKNSGAKRVWGLVLARQ